MRSSRSKIHERFRLMSLVALSVAAFCNVVSCANPNPRRSWQDYAKACDNLCISLYNRHSRDVLDLTAEKISCACSLN